MSDLSAFFSDTLKSELHAQGARPDLVDAIFPLPLSSGIGTTNIEHDLAQVVDRVVALAKFLDTRDGQDLLVAYKRATNIVHIEERKEGRKFSGKPDPHLYAERAERELAVGTAAARHEAELAAARGDFATAMHAIAMLRPFVDAFFAAVTVNAPNRALRESRLKLLQEFRNATCAVADFSQIDPDRYDPVMPMQAAQQPRPRGRRRAA
jgi:glycyl-tRNA synthetase beta chain